MKLSQQLLSYLAAGALFAGAASAQTHEDFVKAFSGDWYVFDRAARANGQTCSITLSEPKEDATQEVMTKGCSTPLNAAQTWEIVEGRIVLSSETAEIAAMGGNQFRVTGELKNMDNTVVMERSNGDGNSARIAAALGRHKCYYVGFTQECAETAALKMPEIPEDIGFATVETLANLNARAQPRRDAATLGKVAVGTEVKINQCITASDGNWCRAQVGDSAIWLAMTALRMDEWPIVTFKTVERP
ncbi:SH3 domain-containing protein [Sulfitobacter sp. 915]|uniref:SH3 domain-containing protein n=1 Tax=Sulfitobacter sp. 915 TaxID=3368558 RepID=UPI0037462301